MKHVNESTLADLRADQSESGLLLATASKARKGLGVMTWRQEIQELEGQSGFNAGSKGKETEGLLAARRQTFPAPGRESRVSENVESTSSQRNRSENGPDGRAEE